MILLTLTNPSVSTIVTNWVLVALLVLIFSSLRKVGQ